MWRETGTKGEKRLASMRRALLYLVVFALVVGAFLYGRSQSPAGVAAEDQEGVALYVEALGAVKDDYVGQEELDSQEQTYGAIRGMIDSLGDEGHTRFLTPDETEKNHSVNSGTYVGVGIKIEDRDDEVVVQAPTDGSPAEEAGIKSGDTIIAVDGESVQGQDTRDVTERIRGPEGSQVELTVLRDEEEYEFTVERAELELEAASWAFVPGTDVAHLRLISFSENSAAELEQAIVEAQGAGAEGFVLDLRDNAGGLLDQAQDIAAYFLPAGDEIFARRDAEGTEEETFVPDDNEPLVTEPVVVLANDGSASAAEILAGALRDNGRATLVGETTFGTGTVLSEYPLSDGSTILLGIAEWLTPEGDFIRGSGIAPDVEVALAEDGEPRTPDEYEELTGEEIFADDAQLERAFEVLQEEG